MSHGLIALMANMVDHRVACVARLFTCSWLHVLHDSPSFDLQRLLLLRERVHEDGHASILSLYISFVSTLLPFARAKCLLHGSISLTHDPCSLVIAVRLRRHLMIVLERPDMDDTALSHRGLRALLTLVDILDLKHSILGGL